MGILLFIAIAPFGAEYSALYINKKTSGIYICSPRRYKILQDDTRSLQYQLAV